MNQQKILELIQASQATLKHELMPKHPESRYNLLMLQRSFEIVKNKMVLKSLHIEEKLRDFTFKRFDEKGAVFTDANNFYTNIKLLNTNLTCMLCLLKLELN